MAEIEFIYKGRKTIIECNLSDIMKDIIKKYKTKVQLLEKNIFFMYGGNNINEDLKYDEQANSLDKERKKMCIIVEDYDNDPQPISLVKSKNIICPKCKEKAIININNYKILLNKCKQEDKIEELFFNEYEETQYIDESLIICKCKLVNKSNSYNNQFFKCLICNILLCPLCKNSHDKNHKIIDYDKIPFICEKHFAQYTSFCNDCENDLCLKCEKEHSGHKIISYGSIMPDKQILDDGVKELRTKINEYKNNINEIHIRNNIKIKNFNG